MFNLMTKLKKLKKIAPFQFNQKIDEDKSSNSSESEISKMDEDKSPRLSPN